MRLHSFSLLGILLGSCFDPTPISGGACAPGNRCPEPLLCIAEVCRSRGDEIGNDNDSGPAGDGGVIGVGQCPAGYLEQISGSCHRFVSDAERWGDAEALCERDGAHLIIPDSVAEAVLLRGPTWIGISDRKVNGVFITVTGLTPTFLYWEQGEPAGEKMNCAHASGSVSSRWVSGPCDFPFPYVCEYDGVTADPTSY